MVENCTDVNNAACDLGIIGDLNTMEHLNHTIESLLRLDKVREGEKHNKRSRKAADGEKGGVTEETETSTE
jgi:hypothetical protein